MPNFVVIMRQSTQKIGRHFKIPSRIRTHKLQKMKLLLNISDNSGRVMPTEAVSIDAQRGRSFGESSQAYHRIWVQGWAPRGSALEQQLSFEETSAVMRDLEQHWQKYSQEIIWDQPNRFGGNFRITFAVKDVFDEASILPYYRIILPSIHTKFSIISRD